MHLTYDRPSNSLRLTRDDAVGEPAGVEEFDGVIDVAARGRLVGIELRGVDLARRLGLWTADPIAGDYTHLAGDGSAYIDLSAGPPDDDVRSSAARLHAEVDRAGRLLAVVIPRRGVGYEISYPSGNR